MQYMFEKEVMPILKSLGLEALEPQIKDGLSKYESQEQDLDNGPWKLTQSQRIGLQMRAQKLSENIERESAQKNKTVQVKEDIEQGE